MTTFEIVAIGAGIGLVLGVLSSLALGAALVRAFEGPWLAKWPAERREWLVRVVTIAEVVVFTVVGGLVAYFGFGGA